MSGPTRGELIAKIRKLRERAAADHGPEGRNAARLARELMAEHGISAADLRDTSPSTRATRTMPARPSRAQVPLSIDLDLGGIHIRWSGKI